MDVVACDVVDVVVVDNGVVVVVVVNGIVDGPGVSLSGAVEVSTVEASVDFVVSVVACDVVDTVVVDNGVVVVVEVVEVVVSVVVVKIGSVVNSASVVRN